jgi:hypothetical protein
MYQIISATHVAKILDIDWYWLNYYQKLLKDTSLHERKTRLASSIELSELKCRVEVPTDLKGIPMEMRKSFFPTSGYDLFEKEMWKMFMNQLSDYSYINYLNHTIQNFWCDDVDYPGIFTDEDKLEYEKRFEEIYAPLLKEHIVTEQKIQPMHCSQLDADTLLNVFSYCEQRDLFSFRLVNMSWNSVATSNYYWKSVYEFSIGDATKIEDAFAAYIYAIKRIPKVTSGTYTRGKVGCTVAMDSTHFVNGIDYTYLKVTSDEVTYNTHKVAVLLSLLNMNQYIPHLDHLMKVGYTYNYTLMPLSKVCHALLTETERELFPIDNSYERQTRKKLKSVAVGPHVDGAMSPFCYYLYLLGKKTSIENLKKDEGIDPPYYLMPSKFPIDYERIGDPADVESVYRFQTDEEGFSPGFFNASFRWFYHADFVSFYNRKTSEIIVAKIESIEGVF